jgi:hypothetical protein
MLGWYQEGYVFQMNKETGQLSEKCTKKSWGYPHRKQKRVA